tara:strand:+ start:1819 stop:2697 length:879 start_codon:yes stop_codon:yes gene_type:complete
MINLSELELSEICHHLGELHPIHIKPVFGGNIHSSWSLDFRTSKIFVKKNTSKKLFLKFEEYCLNNLREYVDDKYLLIPKVISYKKIQNSEILILEWIEMQNSNHKNLGKGLAIMHLNSQNRKLNKFGYPIEGFIGTNPQIKGWEENWADFFMEYRLKPQLFYLNNDIFSPEIIEKLKKKVKQTLSKYQPVSSLVHGDLWSGNIGIAQNYKGVIFDPASWWADSEVDIAMTKLFGGFGNDFYDEYYKINSRTNNCEKRNEIYNLYHILNHANMFGGGYISQLSRQIKIILNF